MIPALQVRDVLLAAALSGGLLSCSRPDLEAREQLVRLYGRIKVGTTQEEIERWLQEPQFGRLHYSAGSLAPVAVTTPGEFGAKNWIICCELKGKVVTTARVGTMDSCMDQPEQAPRPVEFE